MNSETEDYTVNYAEWVLKEITKHNSYMTTDYYSTSKVKKKAPKKISKKKIHEEIEYV